jgi:NitT/TauT family transport system substrate-binding protein
LLAANGLIPNQIAKKSVPVIPERYQLLLQGRLKAATLPDPLAKSALEAGARAVIDDSTHPQYSVSVLSFSIQALETKATKVSLRSIFLIEMTEFLNFSHFRSLLTLAHLL